MKKSAKKVKSAGPEMPDLVTAMIKLVERLESLEKKTDLVLGRVSNLPSDMRNLVQNLQRPQPSFHSAPAPRTDQISQPNRMLYQAVCSDCRKGCEVPFKPTGERPVYCKECFAIRKAGHVPKDLTSHVVVPQHLKDVKAVPVAVAKAGGAPASKKPASKPAKKVAKKKKK